MWRRGGENKSKHRVELEMVATVQRDMGIVPILMMTDFFLVKKRLICAPSLERFCLDFSFTRSVVASLCGWTSKILVGWSWRLTNAHICIHLIHIY